MKRITSYTVLFVLFAGFSVACVNTEETDDKQHQMVVTSFKDAEFVSLDPDQPNAPEIARLWGDPEQGPSALLLKISKGEGARHLHTSDYHLVLLEGKMKHWADEEDRDDAESLERGSYWFQPGDQPHVDICLTDTCLMFVKWEGKMDAELVEPPGEND